MLALKIIAFTIIILYLSAALLLCVFQIRLIFQPGKLSRNFKFKNFPIREEVFLKTQDGETINGLFFPGRDATRAILYFHGNAGDLSGWQFVAEDLLPSGLSVFIIDYRGYGKSSGKISERGFYADAESALLFLVEEKGIDPNSIIVYGRSIGSGVAVEMAARKKLAGVVLESPYDSLASLANEKLPFFFPSLYLRSKFDNQKKLDKIACPVVLIHGTDDSLIPVTHSSRLYKNVKGKKLLVLIDKGQHNDLHSFVEYKKFISETMPLFFFKKQGYTLYEN
jgi:uncharacterized protein